MCYEACKGLSCLESKGIIHGDVALRNFLVYKDNHDGRYVVKISDFGILKTIDSFDLPAIYSPEALESKKLTLKNDIWSFGVAMWEIFTFGQAPYGWHTKKEMQELQFWRMRNFHYLADVLQ